MEDCCTHQIQTLGTMNQRNKHTLAKQSGIFHWESYSFIYGALTFWSHFGLIFNNITRQKSPGFAECLVDKRERKEHRNAKRLWPNQKQNSQKLKKAAPKEPNGN